MATVLDNLGAVQGALDAIQAGISLGQTGGDSTPNQAFPGLAGLTGIANALTGELTNLNAITSGLALAFAVYDYDTAVNNAENAGGNNQALNDIVTSAELGLASAVGSVVALGNNPWAKGMGLAISLSATAAKAAWDNGWRPNGNNGIVVDFSDVQKNYKDYRTRMNRDFIDPNTKTNYDNSKNWQPRRDPLTLDLDGDGIETVGVSSTNPILFDHDGDGIKNGTGWVASDDGMLVLDRNGNGSIDSGRELFGDSTIKSNGQVATNGFNALADIDSNADGLVNSADSQYANLRIWRDLNQDGVSQTAELFSLASQNITAIHVASTLNSQTLANGNQVADLGTYTKTDGSTGVLGEVTGDMADINLADDTFHRSFPNVLDTSAIANLPDMQGSGAVRDLREAATQSSTLQSLLSQYSAATTRAGQMALIDQLLDAWADTSGYAANDADWRVAA